MVAIAIVCLLFFFLFPIGTIGQTAARPDRGVQPSGSYSISDIEDINLSTGNVSLSIPLAALPPIAGGKLSLTLRATYNSKLWDVTRHQVRQTEPPIYDYIFDTPQLSQSGGWSVYGGYRLLFRESHEDFDWAFPTSNESDFNYLSQHQYWHKRFIVTPDGAEHELRPLGYNPYSGARSYLWGYYEDSPDNIGQPISYYTIDGSYLWAKIYPLNHPSGIDAEIYARDGTIVRFANGLQRIIDLNGNEIRIWSDTEATHYVDQQTGREIRVDSPSPGVTRVQYQTVGGIWMHIDVNWGTTYVQGQTYSTNVPVESGGNCERPTRLLATVGVVREIILPQTEPGQPARRFSFNYNSDTTESVSSGWWPTCDVFQPITSASTGWGALKQMVLPSGAIVNYSYSFDTFHELVEANEASREGITSKTITHDGVTDSWSYGYLSVTNPDGSFVTEAAYPQDVAFPSTWGGPTGLGGLVYRTNRSNKVIVERRWERKVFSGAVDNFTGLGLAVFNPEVVAEYTSLLDDTPSHNPVQMSAKTYQYDYNGNVLQETDYDWFDPSLVSRDSQGVPISVPASASVLRVINNTFYNDAASSTSANVYAKRSLTTGAPLILSAIQQTTLGPAITQFSYDGQAYGVAPTAGNLTVTKVWDDVDTKWITTSNTYGLYGNIATTTDGRGKVVQYFFDDAAHALPNRVVVDPQNGTGTQTTTTVYDYSTGLVTSTTDANGATSTIDYTNQLLGTVDPFGRPGVVIGPLVNVGGINQHHRVTTTYEDHLLRVIVASDLNSENDKLLKTRTTTDMLGRPVLNEQTEDGTNYTLYSQKAYTQFGRISFASSVMRTGSSSTTDSWTRVTNDVAGRAVEMATFGGAAQPPSSGTTSSATGTVTTAYDANFTTVTDQAGKLRRSKVDALGRLIRVDEPDANNVLGSTASPVQPTSYGYDVFGNLWTVTQGTQTRTFTYDSLSRLRSANNPESGTITYAYDDNGNLTSKTDARGVVMENLYDALNRVTTILYRINGQPDPNTGDVEYLYDNATNGKGRLWLTYRWGAKPSQTAVGLYDALGRVTQLYQLFGDGQGGWSAGYEIDRTYNLAGGVTSQSYPSGHSITYNYDAAGRATSFTGNLGDGVQRTYSTGISYVPSGALKQEQFGTTTPVYNKLFYNSRLQLAEILASTTGGDSSWNRGKIINGYSLQCSGASCNATDNNGNLRRQQVYIPTDDQISSSTTWYQQYDYDNLNRLQRVQEYTPSLAWQQEYVYDRWGNRTIHQTNTWGTGINKKNFAVNTATNRLGVPAGQSGAMTYDAAGNLTTDSYSGYGSATFDGDNRIVAAQDSYAGWSYYTYNADGQRVRRKINNQETWQVYGIEGELLAEYPANGAVGSPQKEYGYRNGQLLVTAEAGTRTNVALASNGGTATASSTLSPYVPAYVINGSRRAINSEVWLDSTYASFPDWVQVDFNGSKTISEIDVITQQDDPQNPIEPTLTQTFSLYGITAFDVQYWTGSAWATVPGGSVSGNNKVWRQFSFSLITTSKIRVLVNAGADNAFSRVVEVEAWTGPGPTNYALTTNGGTATASSTFSSYLPEYVINGSRRATNGDVWLDNTYASFPDWVQVDFNGSKTISEIDVITQQDDPQNPIEPTLTQTFSLYGITAFDVQYWTGSAWATVPGGSVTGNNKVWRQFTFAPITTSKIRVVVNGGADNAFSRVVEVEAWSGESGGTASNIHWLISDHLGTPRMIFDQSGNLANVKRHDYLPFGEELFTTTGLRTTALGYSGGDGVRQQFTSKERDSDTTLDHFGTRYYASMMGRFTSPDEPLIGQDEPDPQTWNLYAYTSNSPLTRVDADGQRWFYRKNGDTWEVLWVDPNDDGTYTSPGQDWKEFIPSRENGFSLVFYSEGHAYYFFEGKDGSPRGAEVWTGKVENKPDHIIGAAFIFQDIINLARASFAAWQAARTVATEEIKDVVTQAGTNAVKQQATNAAAGRITGFTRHGLNQAISRDGGGVSTRAMADAVKNPLKVVAGARTTKYIGRDAVVVLNKAGKVVTTWARNSAGRRL
jgi:RHS repeat-associated protein